MDNPKPTLHRKRAYICILACFWIRSLNCTLISAYQLKRPCSLQSCAVLRRSSTARFVYSSTGSRASCYFLGNHCFLFRYGAFHGSEVPFVFYDDFELITPSEKALSLAMVQMWESFAATGDPGGVPGLPEWPAYNSSTDKSAVFGGEVSAGDRNEGVNISVVAGLKSARCRFWDTYRFRD